MVEGVENEHQPKSQVDGPEYGPDDPAVLGRSWNQVEAAEEQNRLPETSHRETPIPGWGLTQIREARGAGLQRGVQWLAPSAGSFLSITRSILNRSGALTAWGMPAGMRTLSPALARTSFPPMTRSASPSRTVT